MRPGTSAGPMCGNVTRAAALGGSAGESALSGGNQDTSRYPYSRSRPRVLVVLGEVVEDLMPRSLRADEHVRCRLERWLVDE